MTGLELISVVSVDVCSDVVDGFSEFGDEFSVVGPPESGGVV